MKRFRDYGEDRPNKAPPPNRRPHFPLGIAGEFGYPVCAPPASPAAVGEARRWAWQCPRRLRAGSEHLKPERTGV